MDPVIEEMVQRLLYWGHRHIAYADWQRWATYLRDEVQPQLDELAALKTETAPVVEKRKPGRPKRETVPA